MWVNKYLLKYLLSILFVIYPEVELLNDCGNCKFLRNYHTVFYSVYTILFFHQQCTGVPISLHPSQHCYILFFDNSHPNECEMVSCCCFDLNFPNSHVEHLFMCALAIYVFFGEMSVQVQRCPFLHLVGWFFFFFFLLLSYVVILKGKF